MYKTDDIIKFFSDMTYFVGAKILLMKCQFQKLIDESMKFLTKSISYSLKCSSSQDMQIKPDSKVKVKIIKIASRIINQHMCFTKPLRTVSLNDSIIIKIIIIIFLHPQHQPAWHNFITHFRRCCRVLNQSAIKKINHRIVCFMMCLHI